MWPAQLMSLFEGVKWEGSKSVKTRQDDSIIAQWKLCLDAEVFHPLHPMK